MALVLQAFSRSSKKQSSLPFEDIVAAVNHWRSASKMRNAPRDTGREKASARSGGSTVNGDRWCADVVNAGVALAPRRVGQQSSTCAKGARNANAHAYRRQVAHRDIVDEEGKRRADHAHRCWQSVNYVCGCIGGRREVRAAVTYFNQST
jgi:hypothetical protein